MLYNKLPIVFLSTIASEKKGSTNSTIASYVLSNLDEMKYLGIKEFAKNCNVSISSISRFCKEIGLTDFAELKQILIEKDLERDISIKENLFSTRIDHYSTMIAESIAEVSKSIAEEKVTQLIEDMESYNKVAAFGLMKAETAALILQSDLLTCNKQVYTNLSYKEQMDYIENSAQDTLIIIFTYTGSYFDYSTKRSFLKKKNRPKIWLISGSKKNVPDYVSDCIYFSSQQDHISHPYQLDFVATILAKEYAKIIE
ncbi:MurR/RpiR family transcriptional regulator [Enterococcus sp. LJL99]